MDLEKFWDNTVKKGHRHIVSHMSTDKIKRLRQRFQTHTLDQIECRKLKNAMDWGCGGGLLAKMLPYSVNLHLVDLVNHSLDSAEKYIGRPINKIKLNEIEEFDTNLPQIDLLWCYSVIHHFPDIEYFKKVCAKWNEIKPKRIAIKTKFWKKAKEAGKYEDGFLDALILSKQDLLNQFPGYKLEYWEKEETSKYWHFGFAILVRQ